MTHQCPFHSMWQISQCQSQSREVLGVGQVKSWAWILRQLVASMSQYRKDSFKIWWLHYSKGTQRLSHWININKPCSAPPPPSPPKPTSILQKFNHFHYHQSLWLLLQLLPLTQCKSHFVLIKMIFLLTSHPFSTQTVDTIKRKRSRPDFFSTRPPSLIFFTSSIHF